MPGILYVVATPIGNLGDISPRAAGAFASADFVAAEDTRVTAKLLNHLGLKKPLVSYYQHNMRERGEDIIERIALGETCALCSDAGTPAVSDPGELLVQQAIERGIEVVPICGPCAAITALCASGQITGRFCFEGFLPVSKKSRWDHLDELLDERRTMIFYEAPHKLRNTLRDLSEAFGAERSVTLARELTKIHEEIVRTTLGEAVELYVEREPKGEYVLVVAGAPRREEVCALTLEEAAESVREKMQAEGLSLSEASKRVAAETGFKKSELYKRALSPNGEAPQ